MYYRASTMRAGVEPGMHNDYSFTHHRRHCVLSRPFPTILLQLATAILRKIKNVDGRKRFSTT